MTTMQQWLASLHRRLTLTADVQQPGRGVQQAHGPAHIATGPRQSTGAVCLSTRPALGVQSVHRQSSAAQLWTLCAGVWDTLSGVG